MENLREEVMVNQFVLAAGCDRESAARFLAQAEGQFEVCERGSVSKFFGGQAADGKSCVRICGKRMTRNLWLYCNLHIRLMLHIRYSSR